MGSRYYGLNNLPPKFRQEDVLTDTSTTSTDVEVRINDAKSWKRNTVIQALEAIIRRIRSGTNDLAA